MPPLSVYILLIALAIVSVYWILKAHLDRVVTNVPRHESFRNLLAICLIFALLILGPILTIPVINSLAITISILAILVIIAIIGAYLLSNAYMRQGTIAYRPTLIRYWPSYIFVQKTMVLGETTIIEFGLTESYFDLNLVLISESNKEKANSNPKTVRLSELSDERREKLVHTQDIVVPFQKYEEKAISETGYFLRTKPAVIRLSCVAPDFEPNYREIKTDVDTLVQRNVSFPLVPKNIGRQYIVFNLLDPEGVIKGSIKVRCQVVKNKNLVIDWSLKAAVVISTVLGLIASILLIIEKLSALI